ncbi:MAG: MBL fold metallo-hydrolase [Firmicutes bacterium]|nr:MBL fold metallo-hydrolase [Bacillota bacterium]
MRINVLVDNHASREYSSEWGLSFFIESSKKILFDFGSSNMFMENAKKLGIDISSSDNLVLSHGHWDHGNGLEYITNKKLICHPDAFIKRYRKNKEYIGLPFSIKEAKKRFDLILSRGPFKIDENIVFLGQTPKIVEFESKDTSFIKEDGSKDFVMDDSALVFNTKKGLVIITGCAHSGICNIIEYSRQITGVNKIYAVIGGFHLKGNDELTTKTINYLKKLDIDIIRTSHCTKFDALVEFYNVFKCKPFASGSIIEL